MLKHALFGTILFLGGLPLFSHPAFSYGPQPPATVKELKGAVRLYYKQYGKEFGVWPFRKDRIKLTEVPVKLSIVDENLGFFPNHSLGILRIKSQKISVDLRNLKMKDYFYCGNGYGFLMAMTPYSFSRTLHVLLEHSAASRSVKLQSLDVLNTCDNKANVCETSGPYSYSHDIIGVGGPYNARGFDPDDVNEPFITFEFGKKYFVFKSKARYCEDVEKWTSRTRSKSKIGFKEITGGIHADTPFDYEFLAFYKNDDAMLILEFEFKPALFEGAKESRL